MLIGILARSTNNVIGKDNWLPWDIPSDFKHFKDTTNGNTVIMGRLTFESLGSKELPNRKNIVISRKVGDNFTDMESAIKYIENNKKEKIYLIGGSQIYDYFMKNGLIDRLVISEVECVVDGDSYFDHNTLINNNFKMIKKSEKIQKKGDQFPYIIKVFDKCS